MSTLFGSGMLGLRALATGLPVSFLLNPRKAMADTPPSMPAQYIILNTSGQGDPINCNCPGTYNPQFTDIVHSADPTMAPTSLTLAGSSTTAAAPWATLPQNVLDRSAFFHVMTNTPVHPKEPDVLQLMGATASSEMLPSVASKILAPLLKTIQSQPISVGATTPSETITFGGAPLPIIPPLALAATLTNAPGELTNLQSLRDSTLNSMYALYKNNASPAQKAYIDAVVTSQTQVRNIKQELLNALVSIKDNTPASQIIAAITLIQMGVSPVVAIHIPFGGDNHSDPNFVNEAAQTVTGVQTIATLMSSLATAGIADSVTFLSLNVFGRTLGPGNSSGDKTLGRQHNQNHQVSIAIGKGIKGGVYGGITPTQGDYGALPIDSKTGEGSTSGDITALSTLASFGKTALTAVGCDATSISTQITSGTVIAGALANGS
jgi:hypothetical protein